MITEIRGIVLSQQDYRDKDVLLKVAAKDYGLITLIGKSVRALSSKNAPACLPFMESSFMVDYNETRTIHVLTGAQTIVSHRKLREDLLMQAMAAYVCDAFGYLMQNSDGEPLYDELCRVLGVMEGLSDSRDLMLCFALFQAKLCYLFGIEPYVDGCVSCGSEKGICTISIPDGGFLCEDCIEPMMKRYTRKMLYLFRLLMKADYEHLAKIPSDEETIRGMIAFLFAFIREHTSFTPVSEKFIVDILHL